MQVTCMPFQTSTDVYDNADPIILRLEDCESLRLPPGLELSEENVHHWLNHVPTGKDHSLVLEVGLPAKVFGEASDGNESDDASVGSSAGNDTSLNGSITQDLSECCLPKVVSIDQQLTSKTKLSAKANSFVPSGVSPMRPVGMLPFVPMAAVLEAWQQYEDRWDAKA